jgi:predicted nucleic acid-binding protein
MRSRESEGDRSITGTSLRETRLQRLSPGLHPSIQSVSEKTSTLSSIPPLGNGPTPDPGLLDTSVVIALETVEMGRLPSDIVVSALTLAELARGPAAASSAIVRAHRQDRVHRAEQTFRSISFDRACAQAYGQICATVVAAGLKVRRTRSVDLMIAATAHAHRLPLYTLNASDLRGVEGLVEIVDLN